MKWEDYYSRFWDWAESTRISNVSKLTDFTFSAQIVEIAGEFCDAKSASRLVNRALNNGIRFTPDEIIVLSDYVSEPTLRAVINNRNGQFNEEQFDTLESVCLDGALLEAVAKADGIKRESDDASLGQQIIYDQPVHEEPGLLSALFGFASNSDERYAYPGRCTGDCDHCPAHYGYRYGRWYYGHHHAYGCEFGGNDGSGRP